MTHEALKHLLLNKIKTFFKQLCIQKAGEKLNAGFALPNTRRISCLCIEGVIIINQYKRVTRIFLGQGSVLGIRGL